MNSGTECRRDEGATPPAALAARVTRKENDMSPARSVRFGGLAIAFVVATATPALIGSDAHANQGKPAAHPSRVNKELAQLRRATAAFHNLAKAKAAGWDTDLTGCMDSPAGGMGHHYANIALLMDGGALDINAPEALVFHPQEDGSKRLVAVEYIVLEEHLSRDATPPVLFGQSFVFNEHAELWALHAWVWHTNPEGMFAPWNPRLSCEFAQ
jgi:hypothetical protein